MLYKLFLLQYKYIYTTGLENNLFRQIINVNFQ